MELYFWLDACREAIDYQWDHLDEGLKMDEEWKMEKRDLVALEGYF